MKKQLITLIGAFILGGVLTYFILPEREVITIKKVEVIKEVEVDIVRYVTKVKRVEVIKEIKVSETTTKRTVEKPDGTKITEEIIESSSEQLDRILSDERAKHAELLAMKEKEIRNEYSKKIERTNIKKLNVYGGYDVRNSTYMGGFNYGFWGPTTVGISVTSDGGIYPAIGLRF